MVVRPCRLLLGSACHVGRLSVFVCRAVRGTARLATPACLLVRAQGSRLMAGGESAAILQCLPACCAKVREGLAGDGAAVNPCCLSLRCTRAQSVTGAPAVPRHKLPVSRCALVKL